MQSKHVNEFNHDPWAARYDEDVRNEADPIRAGYADVLSWTIASAHITPDSVVIDLGSGTGNTSALIPVAAKVICVDIWAQMTLLAHSKLSHLENVEFVQADLLGYFDDGVVPFDALVSTYAIHHLTEPEKSDLFVRIWHHLRAGGYAAFGDLMFANAGTQAQIAERYQSAGDQTMVETFDEEFFWQVDRALAELKHIGFEIVETRRFSELSWGICVRKPQ